MSNTIENLSVKIPFTGFYESSHDALIDDEINTLFETDDSGCHYAVPQEIYMKADFGAMHESYAAEYVQAFAAEFQSVTGLPLPVAFEELTSPREYNFTTDRTFAAVPFAALQAIYDDVMADDGAELQQVLNAKHKSRDGFISFYSHDLDEWKAKPLAEWDHNELESLIRACLIKHGEDFDDSENFFGWNLMDSARGNGVIHNLVCENIPQNLLDFGDWQREQGRECDFDAWEESPAYAAYVAECKENGATPADFEEWETMQPVPPYRCKDTPDFFTA